MSVERSPKGSKEMDGLRNNSKTAGYANFAYSTLAEIPHAALKGKGGYENGNK